jgi:hypothetical protein
MKRFSPEQWRAWYRWEADERLRKAQRYSGPVVLHGWRLQRPHTHECGTLLEGLHRASSWRKTGYAVPNSLATLNGDPLLEGTFFHQLVWELADAEADEA